ATALDVTHDGKRLGAVAAGGGVDIIAYSPALGHLYVPGGDSATMRVIAVGPNGDLKVLATVPTAPDAHCVAAERLGNAYVCVPQNGRLLLLSDGFNVEK